MIVDEYGNYVRKFMWRLCGWSRVDICMTFHMRAFDFFFITLHINLTKLRDYELSKKCQLYPTHTVATYIFVHSCHTYPRSF
jgi:hypothetical protein